MKNTLKITVFSAILLILAGGITSCKDKDLSPIVEPMFTWEILTVVEEGKLEGSKWKLVGIVDAETDDLKELEPKDCESCYTLAFDNSIPYCNEDDLKSFSVRSSTNDLGGCFVIDYTAQRFHVYSFGGTKISEVGDGSLFHNVFRNIQSFFLQENELRLYYNNKQNYLFFKQTEL